MHKSLGAFGLVQGWLWAVALSGPIIYKIFNGPKLPMVENIFFIFLAANCLGYLLIALQARRELLRKFCLPCLSGVMLTVGTLLLASPLFAQPFLLGAVFILAGFTFSILVAFFGVLFCRVATPQAGLYYGLAVSLGTVVYILCAFIRLEYALWVAAAAPLLAVALFKFGQKDYCEEAPTENNNPPPFPLPVHGSGFWLLVFFYFGGGLMYRLLAGYSPLSEQQLFWGSSLSYWLLCLGAGLVIFYRKKDILDLRFLYRPVLPLLGVAFLLFPFLPGGFSLLSFVLFQIGFGLFDTYLWFLLIALARHYQGYEARVFAGGFFVVTGSILLAYLFGKVLAAALPASADTGNWLAIAATVIMFLATFLIQHMTEPKSESSDLLAASAGNEAAATTDYPIILRNDPAIDPAPFPNSDWNRFDLPAAQALTPREIQVFHLLVKGYNNPAMCAELHISNNTLKTHLRNIYRKYDVNNRQELLRLYHQ